MTDDTTPGKDAETGPPKTAKPAGDPAPTAKVEPVTPDESAGAVEPPPPSRGPARFVAILAVIGVVALAATAFFAWQVSQRPTVSPAYGALEQRLAGLEMQLAAAREAAAARPVPTNPPSAARNEALENRLAAIESARDELTTKLEALLAQMDRATQQASTTRDAAATVETNHHLEAIAADLAALKTRLDGMRGEIAGPIEQRLGPIEQKLAAIEARPAPVLPDPQALYQIALDDLVTRVEGGRPFTAAWRTVLAFSRDESAVKPAGTGWVERGEAGIPTTATLLARFAERAPAVAGAEADSESWVDRALDRASRLVSIRRVDPDMPGSTPEAITARVQGKLERGDAAGALADAEQLPAPSKARLGAWLADARARVAAETALAGLAQHTVPAAKP